MHSEDQSPLFVNAEVGASTNVNINVRDDSTITQASRSPQGSSRCSCCTTRHIAMITCFAIIMFGAAAALILGLYELGKLPGIDSESAEAIISSGDYVLWNYHFDNYHGTLEYSLLFTSATDYSVSIYRGICNLTPAYAPFAKLQHSSYLLNFTICPEQTCFFDTYVYEIPSDKSIITYNITNNDYIPNQTNKFEVLAYDYIKRSSNGYYITPSPPIKTAHMTSRNTVFTLNRKEIKKSSYYFFAIKLTKGSSATINQFTINRSGIQALYNASYFPSVPLCKLSQNSTYCHIMVKNNDCLYLYSEMPAGQKITSIEIFVGKTLQRTVIYPSILGGICIIVVTILVVVLYRKKRNNPRIHQTGYFHRNPTFDESDFELKESNCDQENNPSSTQHSCMDSTLNVSSKSLPNTVEKGKPAWIHKSICFDQGGLFHHFDQCGVTIDIPEGAVDRPATLKFGTSQMFPGFSCSRTTENTSYEPISSFIWIDIDTDLSKPAKIYIPHWIRFDETSTSDSQEVVLLVNHSKDNALFHIKEDTHPQLSNSVACVETTPTGCSACLAKKNGEPSKRRYHVAVFERSSLDRSEKEVHVCLLYTMQCLQETEKQYKTDGFARIVCGELKGGISPEGLTISTDVPRDRPSWRMSRHGQTKKEYMRLPSEDYQPNWRYGKLGRFTEKIKESDIAIPQEQIDSRSYPPLFKLKFYTEDPQNITRQTTKITLNGTDSEDEAFSVTVLLGDIDIGRQATLTATTNSDDYEVQLERDDVIIKVIPFLATESVFTDSNSYFNFGKCLGLSVDTMTRLEIKYGSNYGKCTKQILLEWRLISPDSPTHTVTDALEACGYPVLAHYISLKLNQDSTALEPSANASDDLVTIRELLPNENGLLQSEPSVDELCDVLYPHVSDKLKMFGLKLGLTTTELNTIEYDKRNSQNYFIELVDTVRRQDQISWENILRALYSPSMKAYKAIEEIYKHLLSK